MSRHLSRAGSIALLAAGCITLTLTAGPPESGERQGRPTNAHGHGNRIVEPDAPVHPMKLATDALQAGRFAEAERMLGPIVEADPANAGAWYFLGLACINQGDHDAAAKAFEESAARSPAGDGIVSNGWYNAACCHALASRRDTALDCLERALAAGFKDIKQLRVDSDLASIRDSDRYARLAVFHPDAERVGPGGRRLAPIAIEPVVMHLQRPAGDGPHGHRSGEGQGVSDGEASPSTNPCGGPGENVMTVHVKPAVKDGRPVIALASDERAIDAGVHHELLDAKTLQLIGAQWDTGDGGVLLAEAVSHGVACTRRSHDGDEQAHHVDARYAAMPSLGAFLVALSSDPEVGRKIRYDAFEIGRGETVEHVIEFVGRMPVEAAGEMRNAWVIVDHSERGETTRHFLSEEAPYWLGAEGPNGWILADWSAGE